MTKCDILFLDYNLLFLYSNYLNNYNVVVINYTTIKLFYDNIHLKTYHAKNTLTATAIINKLTDKYFNIFED
jgi:hypothetical protein